MRKASKTRRLLEKGGFALPPPSPPQPTRASRRNTMTTKSCPRRPRPAAFGSSPAVGHDDALYGVRRDGAFFLGAVIGGGGAGAAAAGRRTRTRRRGRGGDDDAWGRRIVPKPPTTGAAATTADRGHRRDGVFFLGAIIGPALPLPPSSLRRRPVTGRLVCLMVAEFSIFNNFNTGFAKQQLSPVIKFLNNSLFIGPY